MADKALIERLIENLPQAEPVKVILSTDEIAEGTIDENFACPICLMVVSDPEECAQCDKLFCKECILTCS